MDYTFLIYIFLSLVLTSGGAYTLLMSGRIVSSILFFIGIIAIEVYFGTRWFNGTNQKSIQPSIGNWPPSVNVCPDFLSLYKTENTYYCVDTIGVAPNKEGAIQVFTATSGATPDEKYRFDLNVGKTGTDRTKALCDEAKLKHVTWEGVWDGSTCMGGSPPIPST